MHENATVLQKFAIDSVMMVAHWFAVNDESFLLGGDDDLLPFSSLSSLSPSSSPDSIDWAAKNDEYKLFQCTFYFYKSLIDCQPNRDFECDCELDSCCRLLLLAIQKHSPPSQGAIVFAARHVYMPELVEAMALKSSYATTGEYSHL